MSTITNFTVATLAKVMMGSSNVAVFPNVETNNVYIKNIMFSKMWQCFASQ